MAKLPTTPNLVAAVKAAQKSLNDAASRSNNAAAQRSGMSSAATSLTDVIVALEAKQTCVED